MNINRLQIKFGLIQFSTPVSGGHFLSAPCATNKTAAHFLPSGESIDAHSLLLKRWSDSWNPRAVAVVSGTNPSSILVAHRTMNSVHPQSRDGRDDRSHTDTAVASVLPD